MKVRFGHSPDPDDAFMFWGIAEGGVDTEGLEIDHVMEDIASLNIRARNGELECTAISVAAYPSVAHLYEILTCGGSFGDGYGPIVVSRGQVPRDAWGDLRYAIPGRTTSAWLQLRLALGTTPEHEVVPFDRILEEVRDGKADAGLVIHEGQITFEKDGLTKLLDLGAWWQDRTSGLPLPLGVDCIKSALDEELKARIARVFYRSIKAALDHREEALAYARQFGRGLDAEDTDTFVGMYVNQLTMEMGAQGKAAIRRLLSDGVSNGLLGADPQEPVFRQAR